MQVSHVKKPPLSKGRQQNRLKWAEDDLTVNFKKKLFTDDARGTLDLRR